jgi:hypothetical protein
MIVEGGLFPSDATSSKQNLQQAEFAIKGTSGTVPESSWHACQGVENQCLRRRVRVLGCM